MQENHQPTKKAVWALLSGLVGVIWGILFVVPYYFLPQVFWGVIFILSYSYTANGEGFAQALQGGYTALAVISIVVWLLLIISIFAKRYYRGDRRVPRWISILLVVAGALGVISTLPYILLEVPSLRNTIYQLQLIGILKLPVFFMFTGSAMLSIISGIGYLISLKNFRKKR